MLSILSIARIGSYEVPMSFAHIIYLWFTTSSIYMGTWRSADVSQFNFEV